MKKLIFGLILCLSANAALAAGGGVALDSAPIKLNSKQSLQNGAKLFVNYCQACHSAKFMRYKRLMEDLELTEEQVLSEFTFDPDAKIGDLMIKGADGEQQKAWFDAEPPDLSVISRVYGADWLYTFLRAFYKDDSRPMGWGNTVKVVNMPHPFWSMQGTQELIEDDAATEGAEQGGHSAHTATSNLQITTPGSMTEQEFDDAMADLTTFLVYLGEPGQMDRKSLGWKVMLYLSLFTFLAYLLKVEYWRDIH